MKNLSRFLLISLFLLLLACGKDVGMEGPCDPQPQPDPLSPHHVTVEQALTELESVLVGLDGDQTRSVANIKTVKGSDIIPQTRSGEGVAVEDLVYIANFENNEGYAILGADDRLASVIAITEQGSLTPEQFAAVAEGNYTLDGENPPAVWPDVVAYAAGIPVIGGGGPSIPGTGGEHPHLLVS